MNDASPPSDLQRIADDFFSDTLDADPIAATEYGVRGFDHRMPDPSRAAAGRRLERLDSLAERLRALPTDETNGADWVTADLLAAQLDDQRAVLRSDLWEVSVSASVFGRFSGLLGAVPQAPITDEGAAEDYLSRLAKIPGYLEAVADRHDAAAAEGRTPTAIGLRQAVQQLDGYLASPVEEDAFLQARPTPDSGVHETRWRERARRVVTETVRPGLHGYRDRLAALLADDDPTRRPRDDEHVGVLHVPGGPEGYRAQVRAHTTTDATPEEIHQLGLDLVAGLREEFAELGSRVLGTSDVDEVLRRLRTDPALRFETAEEIEATVTDALRRAEAALPGWFMAYDIAPCTVQQMGEAEARGGALGYYMPPAGDRSRPGAHVVNTYDPTSRTRFEYEALAFHESVPGHHLQIAVSQALQGLPDFRRFLIVTAHAEGWGLYVERLCDRMGLYSDDLSRFGVLSFDAWRACRLVVDTGMHALGWSRDRAIAYMRENSALSESNIANEVDRYIAAPGQALAYMVGRIRINELADRARAELGSAFDIRGFHDVVLGNGNVGLGTLERLVDAWITATTLGDGSNA